MFATHNGERTLPRMMAALERLNPPEASWRILAVDNASTDATRAILQAAAARLPLTMLSCGAPGKSPALKAALQQSRAPLLVFTDDDVEPAPDWLRAYENEARLYPEAGVFGGPIVPTPIDPVGPWYDVSQVHHAELFARSDHPDGDVDAPAHIYGPNYMIRRAHAAILDEATQSLGPTFVLGGRAKYPMGEDTQKMELLTRCGVRARYVRAASVKHLVREFQTELAYMLARAERHGRGTAIRYVASSPHRLRRRLRVGLQCGGIWLAKSLAARGADVNAQSFDLMWDAYWARGAMLAAVFGR